MSLETKEKLFTTMKLKIIDNFIWELTLNGCSKSRGCCKWCGKEVARLGCHVKECYEKTKMLMNRIDELETSVKKMKEIMVSQMEIIKKPSFEGSLLGITIVLNLRIPDPFCCYISIKLIF